MLRPVHRKRIEDMIEWAEKQAVACATSGHENAANHHKARASAMRGALAEIDRLDTINASLAIALAKHEAAS